MAEYCFLISFMNGLLNLLLMACHDSDIVAPIFQVIQTVWVF